MKWLTDHDFVEIVIAHVQKNRPFVTLKAKYQATQHQDSSPSSPRYPILKRLDAKKQLSNEEVNWLKSNELVETLNIVQQQEYAREAKFAELKDKYQATKHPELSVSSPLYNILQHLDTGKPLKESELYWLKEHELGETFDMDQEIEQKQHFAELKKKYQATQYEDSSPSSHLYPVLKRLDAGNKLSESELNFLKKRKLTDTIAFAVDKNGASLKSTAKSGNPLSQAETDGQKSKGRENPTVSPQKHFADLKSKYGVSGYQDNLPSSQLYAILQKLDNGERLDTDVAWLLAEKKIPTRWDEHKLFSGKILQAYHKIEATFYEQTYKRTGNKWNLPSASSHWRGAKEPKRALTQTDNLNFDTIKENKLKSALLTTRGGAFRDIGDLDEAEQCARRAIKYQPSSHHPYTLMGAICFERHETRKYAEGEYWFKEAIKRGASPRDQDAEMKRVVKNADKDKRRKVVKYLLKTDPVRYEWANTLMGAICYEWGEYSEGEHWFSEAVKRGASPRESDAEIKRVIKNADKDKRREVVEYLLKTNPVRYEWAKKYLVDKQ